MNCDLAGRLMDDYLQDELGHRDRYLLETHVARCTRCAAELRMRPAFERDLRRALAISVYPLSLSSNASRRIVHAAEDSLRRAILLRRAYVTLRFVAAALVVVLFGMGLYSLSLQRPMPYPLNRIGLFPTNKTLLSEVDPATLSAQMQSTPELAAVSNQRMPRATLFFEPRNMRPNTPFTMTLFLENETPRQVETFRFDLDVNGPTGFYRFGLAVKGPLPAHGASVVRLTRDVLTKPCQEQYSISPTDLFAKPGVYTLRLTLLDHVVASR